MKKYWNKIRKNYPKAFNKLVKAHDTIEAWGEIDSPKVWGKFIDEEHWALRHLYDFFDSKKLNIWVYTSNNKEWHYCVLRKGRFATPSKNKYASRILCELAAWEKAFELLEEKIK